MSNWIEWSKQIAAIAQTGLYFAQDPFDKERYEQLSHIAILLLSTYSDGEPQQINHLLTMDDGYITPKVDVRGAVIKDNQILLVKEKSDGKWTLPGGWADVGDAPSVAVEREIREESGYNAKAVKLLALQDRKQHHPHYIFEVYKIFFLCELIGGSATTSIETTDVSWFAEDDIPELSTGRVIAQQIRLSFKHYHNPSLPTEFD